MCADGEVQRSCWSATGMGDDTFKKESRGGENKNELLTSSLKPKQTCFLKVLKSYIANKKVG